MVLSVWEEVRLWRDGSNNHSQPAHMAETIETILLRDKHELEALLKAGDEQSMLPVLQRLSAQRDITIPLLRSTKVRTIPIIQLLKQCVDYRLANG